MARGDGPRISTARKICADEKHAWESSGAGAGDLTEKVVIDYEAIMQSRPLSPIPPLSLWTIHPSNLHYLQLPIMTLQLLSRSKSSTVICWLPSSSYPLECIREGLVMVIAWPLKHALSCGFVTVRI